MPLEVIHFAIAIRLINLLLLSYLISFYFRGYKKIKSEFTVGMLFFSALLFIQNLSAIYFRLFEETEYILLIDEIYMHNFILNLIQMAGLISLVILTRK